MTNREENLNEVVFPLESAVVVVEDLIESASSKVFGALAVEPGNEGSGGRCGGGAHCRL